jgi:lipopolysaccharide export LptBFGC system permease protein LptF
MFCLSFMPLATALARSRRRLVVVPALFAAFVATNLLLLSTMRYGVAGDIPAFLAVWGPHLVPLSLVAILHLAMRRRQHVAERLS